MASGYAPSITETMVEDVEEEEKEEELPTPESYWDEVGIGRRLGGEIPETDMPDKDISKILASEEEIGTPDFSRELKRRIATLRRLETNKKSKTFSRITNLGKRPGEAKANITKGAGGTRSKKFYDDVTLTFNKEGTVTAIKFRGTQVMRLPRGGKELVPDNRAKVAYASFRSELVGVPFRSAI